MEIKEIKNILLKNLNLDKVEVYGDGEHFTITVISNIFEKMNKLKRHQIIYKPLMKYISNNTIHAISINAFSPQEWLCKKNLLKIK